MCFFEMSMVFGLLDGDRILYEMERIGLRRYDLLRLSVSQAFRVCTPLIVGRVVFYYSDLVITKKWGKGDGFL